MIPRARGALHVRVALSDAAMPVRKALYEATLSLSKALYDAAPPVRKALGGAALACAVALLASGPASAAGSHARHKAPARQAEPAPPQRLRLALVSDIPQWPSAEHDTERLFTFFAEQHLDAVLHAGGIKGDTESCGDALLQERLALLDRSPLPLLYVPGETDWAECSRPVNGKFDAVERLNRLRELAFPADNTHGQRTLPVIRQSDHALFRSFRENVRMVLGNVLVVGLNLPGDNNHYRSEGGRNGEFEDRREANRQWLARAFSLAAQRKLDGIVLVAHGDPQFENGWEKRGNRPSLFDGFVHRRTRDGYLEFKRQLRELTARFKGVVLLVHASNKGFGLDTPLRDAAGKVVANFQRVTLPPGTGRQWAELVITPDTAAMFDVALRDAPAAVE